MYSEYHLEGKDWRFMTLTDHCLGIVEIIIGVVTIVLLGPVELYPAKHRLHVSETGSVPLTSTLSLSLSLTLCLSVSLSLPLSLSLSDLLTFLRSL
jgi:hypothetical protein